MIRDAGPFRRAKIKQWISFLNSKKEDTVIVDRDLKRRLNEMGYYPDFNPASYFNIQELWDTLYLYDQGFNADINYFMKDVNFKRAINLAFKRFGSGGRKLVPVVEEVDLYNCIHKDTSAGLPYMTRKDEAFPASYQRFKDIKKGKKAFNPCLCQFRTQRKLDLHGKPVGKTRNVFAYPLDATLFESQYFYPLQEVYLKKRTPYIAGLWRCDLGCRLDSGLTGKFIYEFDFSKFDTSVPRGLIRVCFNIIKTWYDIEYHKDIDKIFQYFINTPIVMPDGHLYVGKSKGVPSGSCFTQIVDSIVNFIITMAASFRFNMRVNWYNCHFVGDDGIFTSDKDVDFGSISQYLSHFGFNLSPSKSRKISAKEEFHFIGFYYKKGIPHKPLDEVITGMTYPERPRKFPEDVNKLDALMRQIGILSLDSTQLLADYLNCANGGFNVEKIKYIDAKDKGSGYLNFRDKYVLKNGTESYLSGDYLK